jgi:hypothetical protein
MECCLWDYARLSRTQGYLLPLSGGIDSCGAARDRLIGVPDARTPEVCPISRAKLLMLVAVMPSTHR